MPPTFDGFSIRDYTSKMRSIDVFKCWPFTSATSPDVTREELQSWLPPMTLPSQTLRSNRLRSPPHTNHLSVEEEEVSRTDDDDDDDDDNHNQQKQNEEEAEEEEEEGEEEEESVKSDKCDKPAPPPPAPLPSEPDEKLEMVCPVCREFNAATLTAVNAHIDGCLAQTMRDERRHMRIMNFKSKSKAPKKRSIAEIFKVEQREQQELQEKEEEKQKEEEEPRIGSVLKMWPTYDPDDEVAITVNKFRWLSRRLEALRSNRGGGESAKSDGGVEEEEKLEMVCPVCRDFNAATVTAVNAHIDGCLAQAVRDERRQMRRTTKPKAPKKRSIAEILTVAPPISATKSKVVQVEEEDNRDSSGAASVSASAVIAEAVVSTIKSNKSTKNKKKKTKRKVKKKSKGEKHDDSGVSLNNSEKKTKKKKKNFKFFHAELAAKNKEDAYKRKVQTPVNSSRKLESTIGNKMAALRDIDPSIHKKKLGSKVLSVETKKVKIYDSVGKQQKELSPVCGILKNQLKLVSGKTSSGCSIQDGADESHCNDQVPTLDRHVRFTGKDETLGPKKRNSFDEPMFNKSSDVLATSLVKEQSSGSDEETSSLEASRNYDHIAINTEKRKEVCPIDESKQFSHTLEQVTVQNSLKPCTNQQKSKHLEGKSESLTEVAFCDTNNFQLFDGGNTTTLDCSQYSGISRSLSTVQEVQMANTNTDVCESGSFSSIGKFIDHLEDPNFQVAAVNSNTNTRTFLEPSSSYSTSSYDKANERPESPLQTYGDNDNSGQALGYRQLSHMFSAHIIDNSFSFTGWGKGSVRTNCLDPNFFGLPLNSQGELISFSSSGKVGMNEPETSSTSRGSLSGLPVNNILHQSSQESLSINEKRVVHKTFTKDGLSALPRYPARLAVTETQCREREDIHRPHSDMGSSQYVQPRNSELNLMRNSFIEQNQRDRVQNQKGNGMISLKESSDHVSRSSSQPTMRLMGKDVPIGRSSQEMQQFVGDVWADEEPRRSHYSEYAALDNSLLGRCSKQDWASGSPLQISTGNVLQSAKIQSNQVSQSTVLMNGPDSEFPQQFIDLQRNHASQNLGVSRNASSYFHPVTQEPTSCAAFNGTPCDFPEQFLPGSKHPGISSQSQVLATPCNFSQLTCLSNGEMNDRSKSPHVTKSAFEFPFLQSAVNEQAKTSWSQRPYRSLPSWLSSSTVERLPVTFSQQFSGISSQSFPQNIWGSNFTTPSVNHSAEVLYPSNPLTSLGPRKTPLCPASAVQPLHVPVTPSTISGCRNITKVADRMEFDDMTTKDRHPCTNTRKRPAANLDDTRKPIKLPNIEVQENLSRMARLTGENTSTELQRNKRAVELDPQVDSARSRCCQKEAQNLHPTSYPVVDSFKLHGTVTAGPARLGPGAKHILRSS